MEESTKMVIKEIPSVVRYEGRANTDTVNRTAEMMGENEFPVAPAVTDFAQQPTGQPSSSIDNVALEENKKKPEPPMNRSDAAGKVDPAGGNLTTTTNQDTKSRCCDQDELLDETKIMENYRELIGMENKRCTYKIDIAEVLLKNAITKKEQLNKLNEQMDSLKTENNRLTVHMQRMVDDQDVTYATILSLANSTDTRTGQFAKQNSKMINELMAELSLIRDLEKKYSKLEKLSERANSKVNEEQTGLLELITDKLLKFVDHGVSPPPPQPGGEEEVKENSQ